MVRLKEPTKEWATNPPKAPGSPLNFFESFSAGMNPEWYRLQQQKEAQRATYWALLLQSGATDEIACAAALNPDFFRMVAPQYLRPQR
jgi:hypothetical protein